MQVQAGGGRFIPTHVGNTLHRGADVSKPPVHPHARGEHNIGLYNVYITDGSSPRTWGTLPATGVGVDLGRFIPTHVGNTSESSYRKSCFSVHPHARGEHPCSQPRLFTTSGSSPRTWGTQQPDVADVEADRFIPTHVGNTAATSSPFSTTGVHPHARGEHKPVAQGKGIHYGSSPRTWGTLSAALGLDRRVRFIPTHVGNTPVGAAAWSRSGPSTVHPHARGEHATLSQTEASDTGSSPRTWGTLAA